MRDCLLTLAICACSKDAAAPTAAPREAAAPNVAPGGAPAAGAAPTAAPREAVAPDAAPVPAVAAGAASPATGPGVPEARAYPDLAAALVATIPADTRVVGFGELHTRTDRPSRGPGREPGREIDRAPVTSSLASFTRALPAIADKLSDLVLETWLVDPACGKAAVQATARIERTVKRPEETKSEIAELAAAARAAHIQPHAMTLTCADYARIVSPAGGSGSAAGDAEVDAVAMLALTTRELARIATSAVVHRDHEPRHRPWIAVYGGALHNDRFPDPAVAEWSYAAAVDRVTAGRFVEIDLIVPEFAAADPVMQREPWFPLVGAPRDPAHPVVVWRRGERSFVVVLPPS